MARTATDGLSLSDLERIRDTLASGRRPKVVFTESAGQMAGQTGQVVRLTDPEISSEWLVVRFGNDELPFSPGDLKLPERTNAHRPRASTAVRSRKEVHVPTATTTRTAPPSAPSSPEGPSAPSSAAPVRTSTPATTAPADPAGSAQPGTPGDSGKPERACRSIGLACQASASRKPARGGKAKAPSSLTVTLAYQDGQWSVAVHQGSKALARPQPVKPAAALALVGMLDVPGVQKVVDQLVAAERAEAERQAEQLRAQLAEVEARLAELQRVG